MFKIADQQPLGRESAARRLFGVRSRRGERGAGASGRRTLYPGADEAARVVLAGGGGGQRGVGRLWPGDREHVGGFLALDFLFELPRYSLEVTQVSTSLDLVAFFLVAMLLGTLTARLRLAHRRASPRVPRRRPLWKPAMKRWPLSRTTCARH